MSVQKSSGSGSGSAVVIAVPLPTRAFYVSRLLSNDVDSATEVESTDDDDSDGDDDDDRALRWRRLNVNVEAATLDDVEAATAPHSMRSYIQKIMTERVPPVSSVALPPFLRTWPWTYIIMNYQRWMTSTGTVYLCLRASTRRRIVELTPPPPSSSSTVGTGTGTKAKAKAKKPQRRMSRAGSLSSVPTTNETKLVCVNDIDVELAVTTMSAPRRKRKKPDESSTAASSSLVSTPPTPDSRIVGYVQCPPFRNWSVDLLTSECIAENTMGRRLRRLLMESTTRGMQFHVARCVVADTKSPYYDGEFADFVRTNDALRAYVNLF